MRALRLAVDSMSAQTPSEIVRALNGRFSTDDIEHNERVITGTFSRAEAMVGALEDTEGLLRAAAQGGDMLDSDGAVTEQIRANCAALAAWRARDEARILNKHCPGCMVGRENEPIPHECPGVS